MNDRPMEVRLLPDEAATEAAGHALARLLRAGDVLLLEGPLGAGKTTLVRGIVAGLGGDPSEVSSPTFVLLSEYQVAAGEIRRVHHADLYRVRGRAAAPAEEIGLTEAMDDPAGVAAVEWPAGWEWRTVRGRVIRIQLAFEGEGRRLSVRW
jgi:tRNA threonylcarbamoyladenosine biosynthesis protein TsaE